MVFEFLLLLAHVGIQLLGVVLGSFGLEVALELRYSLEDGVELVRPLVALEELHESEAKVSALQQVGREWGARECEDGLEGSEGSKTDHPPI